MTSAAGAVDCMSEARGIDCGLRRLAHSIATDMQLFKSLIDEARSKSIHGLLGFKSWTAYVADVVGKEMTALPVDDRRQIVGLLTVEGMSTRAQAAALGVSNATVSRDQQVLHDVTPVPETADADPEVLHDVAPATVTGRDGKTYPAKPKPKPKPKADVPKVSHDDSVESGVATAPFAEFLADLDAADHLNRLGMGLGTARSCLQVFADEYPSAAQLVPRLVDVLNEAWVVANYYYNDCVCNDDDDEG